MLVVACVVDFAHRETLARWMHTLDGERAALHLCHVADPDAETAERRMMELAYAAPVRCFTRWDAHSVEVDAPEALADDLDRIPAELVVLGTEAHEGGGPRLTERLRRMVQAMVGPVLLLPTGCAVGEPWRVPLEDAANNARMEAHEYLMEPEMIALTEDGVRDLTLVARDGDWEAQLATATGAVLVLTGVQPRF